MNSKNKKGFTLIELLIVIGIIAILAAAVIIAINPGQQFEQARNATRWSHLNSIVNSVYSATIDEGGEFPDCLTNKEGEWVDASECEGDAMGNHMEEAPLDPQGGGGDNDSCYGIKLDGNTITVAPASDDHIDGEEVPAWVADCDNDITDDVTDLEVVQ